MPMNAVNVLYICFDWIGVSYKGSTKVFGSFSRGSIPLAPTKTHVLIYRNTNYSISDIKGKEIVKITFFRYCYKARVIVMIALAFLLHLLVVLLIIKNKLLKILTNQQKLHVKFCFAC